MTYFHIIYLGLLFIFMAGCQPRFVDISRQVKYVPITLVEQEFSVGSPVWLADSEIVFSSVPVAESSNSLPSVHDLRLYDTNRETWEKIPVNINENCNILSFSFLQRLPNLHLGFYSTCLSADGSISSKLQELDVMTHEIRTLLDLDPTMSAGQFSFSPDMSELIQEDMTGRFLSNKLFYRRGDSSEQIVPDFTRAMYPSWSPTDRKIAFWGTENYPGGNPEELDTLPEISALALYPFDLYISSPEGINPRKILSSVKDPIFIKWSPHESLIAFAGTFDNVPGLWLIDPSTSEVTRIWPSSVEFDWSPDGRKIVLVDSEKDQEGKVVRQTVGIIDLR